MIVSTTADSTKLLAQQADGQQLTYGDMRTFVSQFETALAPGRHLGIILTQNTLGSLQSYLACLESERVVPLVLDASMDAAALEQMIALYRPRYVMAPRDYDLCVQRGWGKSLVYADYTLFDAAAPSCTMPAKLGLLLATSGSTGAAKLVRLSYDNVRANAESIAQYLDIDDAERPITSLPMNYSYGLSVINSHVLRGACIALTNQAISDEAFWNDFRTLEATSFAGVPYAYQTLKRIDFDKMDLPTLRTMTQAGGKLSADLHQFFAEYARDTNRRFFVMYGQCEATARMGYLPYERSLEKIESIGIAIPGGSFTLIDENGNTIDQPNTEGELVYRGPNVSMGYALCIDDLRLDDENNGVLVTGDMARFDEEGFFYITGRKSRFLKIFGKRVSLDECEQLIVEQFGIECACGGRDDLLCVYVLDEDVRADVHSWIASKLDIDRSGVTTQRLDAIPRNDAGKIRYKDLPAC